jgi:hypothetical protein
VGIHYACFCFVEWMLTTVSPSRCGVRCTTPHRTAPHHSTTHRSHTMRFKGPTGAGKTFTKFGTDEQFGVMAQAIRNLLR